MNRRSTLLWLPVLMPLLAALGCEQETAEQVANRIRQSPYTLPVLIYDSSEHFSDIESANLDGLLKRIGDSRLVLLGEATHGTAEFYEMRARITRELIEKKGFSIIAAEADWPDATAIDHFIRDTGHKPEFTKEPFSGFPSWMWANLSVQAFTDWLKDYNQRVKSADDSVRFYGLDFYNIYSSMEAVLGYLEAVDPDVVAVAHQSYSCLMPWTYEPSAYSLNMKSGEQRGCAYEVNSVLQQLRRKRALYQQADQLDGRQSYFDAEQNARLVKNGEQYYRTMYQADNDARNLRHQNLFETLLEVLNRHGKASKAVVWAHNTHIGDARATAMGAQGESNLGQRARETFGDSAWLVGFGTDHGTVAAATGYGKALKVMQLQSSIEDSYEHLFHQVDTDNFILPLRNPIREITRKTLLPERLQRAIGTSYDPDDELTKHYLYASLPRQFDEYIWFDETRAVKPLSSAALKERPSTEAMLQDEAGLLNK